MERNITEIQISNQHILARVEIEMEDAKKQIMGFYMQMMRRVFEDEELLQEKKTALRKALNAFAEGSKKYGAMEALYEKNMEDYLKLLK